MSRVSGILMPITSLPSPYGIGCFDQCAYDFVDQLAEANQHLWQILPLGPTGYGDSPYQSFSTFAGNPYFISLEDLIREGALTREECDSQDFGSNPDEVDYGKIYQTKLPLLRLACSRTDLSSEPGFATFCRENQDWLQDYSLYMAIKDDLGGIALQQWPDSLRRREPAALEEVSCRCGESIRFYQYLQYQFDRQWKKLKAYANKKEIEIIGDIPIYVSADSADTWANPQLFQLDEDLKPVAIAGCPPDSFAPGGQLWGNPLYRWSYHKETGFAWWIARIRASFCRCDILRIDHFRGFDAYFSIPAGDKTAHNGTWEKGPGLALFQAVEQALGKRKIIAEDLGYVTDTVRKLVEDTGYPGMKVLEFAFDARDTGGASDYLPHNYPVNSAAYTGTHDNATLMSWFGEVTEEELQMVRDYVCNQTGDLEELCWSMICTAMRSVARMCIIPMQDYLCLGEKGRMNTPALQQGNWTWRMNQEAFTPELIKKIGHMTACYGRAGRGDGDLSQSTGIETA